VFLEFFFLDSKLNPSSYKIRNSKSVEQKFSVKNVQSQKTCFFHFKCKYLAIYKAKVFEISSTHFYTSLVQDPMFKYALETLNVFFALCYRNGSFECFLMKKRLWTLVKTKYKLIPNARKSGLRFLINLFKPNVSFNP